MICGSFCWIFYVRILKKNRLHNIERTHCYQDVNKLLLIGFKISIDVPKNKETSWNRTSNNQAFLDEYSFDSQKLIVKTTYADGNDTKLNVYHSCISF